MFDHGTYTPGENRTVKPYELKMVNCFDLCGGYFIDLKTWLVVDLPF
jgi:hypothetical protein